VASSSHRTSIVVAVRHRDPLLRLGVVAALRNDGRFSVHADDDPAPTPGPGPGPGATCTADVVISDHEAGMALAEATRHRNHPPRVMVLTHRDGETDIRQALARGVLGYQLIGCSPGDVIDGVLALHRGERHLAQAAAMRLAEHLSFQSLTGREIEVLNLVAAGWSNKRVANDLGMALSTAKAHLKAILGKLNARTRTEAAHVALRRGLLNTTAGDRPSSRCPHRSLGVATVSGHAFL